jgi:hypothetical protein
MKSIFQKRITAVTSLKGSLKGFLIACCVVTCIVALLTRSKWAFVVALIVAGLTLFYHLVMGKLKLKNGDVALFFGLPGSGKTMFLAKTAYDNADCHILTNDQFSTLDISSDVVERETFGMYDYKQDDEKLNVILWDEASLNGFDNRDWKSFDKYSMEFLKRIRKYNSAIVFSNQGWDELDKKIKEGLCNYVYYCQNKGSYSVAYRLFKEIAISDLTCEIMEGWRYPTFFERILDPSVVLYVRHRKMGKHYDTLERDTSKPLYSARSAGEPKARQELKDIFRKK